MVNWKDIPYFGSYWGKEKRENWQEAGFDAQKTKEWIDAGLKVSQSEIAGYAEWKGYQPSSVNIADLKKEQIVWSN